MNFKFFIFSRFGTSIRKDPKRMQAPSPGTHEYKSFTTAGPSHKLKRRLTSLEIKEFRENINKKDDGLGPGQYPNNTAFFMNSPLYGFGTRFNSTIRNKDHLRPTKVDGPGPGSHKLPSSVRVHKRNKSQRTTFGTSARNFIELP